MFENIIYDIYGEDEIRYYFSLEECKFGLILNKTNAHKEKEYTLKFLEEERERIELYVKDWKENGKEKVVNWYVFEGKIYLIKRAYYLDYGQIQARESDFGTTILVNPYIKDKDILDKIQEKLFEVA